MIDPRETRAFTALFALCCALLVWPLWTTDFLPMVDLPQHAAQISILSHFGDPQYGYAETYSLNFFTPYLLGYGMAWLLSHLVSVPTALRILVSLAVVSVPFAVRHFNREVGGRPEWAFLGFPIALSYAFGWGFVNYLIGIPLAIWFATLSYRFAAAPTWRRGLVLGCIGIALFWCHVIIAIFSCLIGASLAVLRSENLKQVLLRSIPFVGPFPIAVIWLSRTHATESQVINRGIELGWDLQRLALLPVHVMGSPARTLLETRSLLYLLGGLCLLAIPFQSGKVRIHKDWRLAPLAICLGLYFFTPVYVFGTGFLFPRFAIFILPFMILSMSPADYSLGTSRLSRLLPALFALVWLAISNLAFWGFNRETLDFRSVLAEAEGNKRALSLIYDRHSAYFAGPQYLHFPVWYQAEKGGQVDFSFAMFFPEMVRYRDDQIPTIPIGFEWTPLEFDWTLHDGEQFDLFFIRTPENFRPLVFADRPVRLRSASGQWLLYERAPSVEPVR